MRALPILQNVPVAKAPEWDSSSGVNPPWRHLMGGEHRLVFVVEGSQLFEVTPELFADLEQGNLAGEEQLKAAAGLRTKKQFGFNTLPPPTAVSLNIAQACNLSCTYCYADEGLFGGTAKLMTVEVACETIDRIIADAGTRTVTIGFIGGEPFLNRRVLYRSVDHALAKARQAGVAVRFSVTTNGTLLQPGDIELLRENAFAVSVSLDGDAVSNDRHRRAHNKSSSHGAAITALQPLLRNPGRAKIAARSTLTRDNLRVSERIEALTSIGFREVGVSPLSTSPDPTLILTDADWPILLTSMIEAAEIELAGVWQRKPIRFSNFAIALKEIHRGACRPLPCGAAANYVSVSAEGNYFTCHRTVDNPAFMLGTPKTGPLGSARDNFLQSRHVDRQEPCSSCWARYLCGGGCHAEVMARGRHGCDYIRGWLEYCLRAYNQIMVKQPDFFEYSEGITS